MLVYNAYRNPMTFKRLYVSPLGLCGMALFYALYCDDKAVLGGLGAGYVAFMLAL